MGFINKYIVAYKNYKEIWIKKSRMLEPSSLLEWAKPKWVAKVLREELKRSYTIKKSMRTRNSSKPLRNSVCNNCRTSMKLTCSRRTTLSSTSGNHKCFYVTASFSVRENLLVVSGAPETKSLKEMMPDILKQVGPQQYQFLKEQIGAGVEGKADAADDDDDDVPELVGTFEDVNK